VKQRHLRQVDGNALAGKRGIVVAVIASSRTARGIFLAVALGGCAESSSFTPGDSMLPTLAVGARIDVKKKLDDIPGRGRVIVFRAPEAPDREYVKRVIAIAGDTLSMNGTEVVLNGTPIFRCAVGAWHYSERDGTIRTGELWLEALDGTKWLVFHDAAAIPGPKGPWTVAPGEVFVLGDNREHSHDSRLWFGGKGGALPLKLVVGGPAASEPTLPIGAEPLADAFRACMADASTSPRPSGVIDASGTR
jgi:signal peptidase I